MPVKYNPLTPSRMGRLSELLRYALRLLWWREIIRAALFYAGILAIVYASVIFFGYTLQPAIYAPHGVTDTGLYEYEGRKPINTFNVDMSTSSYCEPTLNKAIGNMYRQGELPLWNPYQAAGMPLAAQYNSRAFFPYQILEDISPTWSWDFFILGRLWLAGFFTFLFLRALKVRPASALLGGLFFMLSGAFTWFIHKQEFINSAMMVPILLWAIERLISSRRAIYFLAAMFSSALVLLAGNPEIAVYILLLGGIYTLYRVVTLYGLGLSSAWNIGVVAVAFGLGLGLSAPLLLPFKELVQFGFHVHPPGGTMGVVDPTPASWGIGLVLPTFFDNPTSQRVIPLNGLWDFLGGYIGVLPISLIIMGLFQRSRHRGLLIFFLIFGGWIVLKNLGVPPFTQIGHLPILDQCWSNRWAGPAWTFSLAVAGALGFEALEQSRGKAAPNRWSRLRNWHILAGAGTLAGILVGVLFLDQVWDLYAKMIPSRYYPLIPHSRDYMVASIQGGVLVAIAVLTMAVLLWRVAASARGRQYAILALAATALWFYIPRGYNYEFIYLKLIPVALGIALVWTLARERWRWAVGILVVAVSVATGMDVVAPYGFPERQDPFQPAPYVEYIKEHGGLSRVMATDGVLIPTTASALDLYDVRYINSITVASYHHYMQCLRGLIPPPWGYPLAPDASALWFTGLPPLTFSKGMNYPLPPVIEQCLPYYSALGVKYIITPSAVSLSGLPLVYEDEVNVYENPDVLPRAFVVRQLEYAPSFEAAQERIGQTGFDWRKTVVLEEKAPARYQNMSGGELSEASIIDYRPNRVVIEVNTNDAGMLVLSDTYFPGWEARVDGRETKIYRVNGVVRGVFVEPGKHTVEFIYSANSFRQGLGVAGLSLVLGTGVCCVMRRRRTQETSSTHSSSPRDWQWWQ